MSSTNNVNDEFITKLRITVSEDLRSKIKSSALCNKETKDLTDILNRIQTDNEFLMKYIKTCFTHRNIAAVFHNVLNKIRIS